MKLRCIIGAMLMALSAMGQPGIGLRSVQVSPRPQIVAKKPEGRVAELIDRLAGDSPEQRRAAVRSLIEMGPAIEPQVRWAWQREEPALNFPFLPVAENSNQFILDPRLLPARYTLYGLEEVLSHLEEQRQLPPSLITLHYTNAPLTNVLADLGSQAGAEVQVGSIYWRPLDWINTNRLIVNVNRVTYWDALQRIEQNAGVAEIFQNLNQLLLTQGSPFGPPSEPPSTNRSVVSGPLKITPISVELARSLNYVGGSTSARVKLVLQARAEPKFWNTGVNALVQVDECVDDQGKSLLTQPGRAFPSADEYPCYWSWKVPVDLGAPGPGGRIKALQGRFSVELAMPQRYLSITNLMRAQGQSREFDGLALAVSKVISERNRNEIEVEVSAPSGSPYARTFTNSPDCCNLSIFDQSRLLIRMAYMDGMWAQENVILLDVFDGRNTPAAPEAGRQFRGIRQEAGRDVISWRLLFSKRLKPTTLLWLTPPGTRWLTVPFELHDLPIPVP